MINILQKGGENVKKFIFAMLMMCTLVGFSTTINSNAAAIEPYANNVQDINAKLSISTNGTASITYHVVLKGNPPHSITATVKLMKRSGNSWVKVHEWTDPKNSSALYIENRKYSLSSHGTYKVTVSAATRSGASYEIYNTDSNVVVY